MLPYNVVSHELKRYRTQPAPVKSWDGAVALAQRAGFNSVLVNGQEVPLDQFSPDMPYLEWDFDQVHEQLIGTSGSRIMEEYEVKALAGATKQVMNASDLQQAASQIRAALMEFSSRCEQASAAARALGPSGSEYVDGFKQAEQYIDLARKQLYNLY